MAEDKDVSCDEDYCDDGAKLCQKRRVSISDRTPSVCYRAVRIIGFTVVLCVCLVSCLYLILNGLEIRRLQQNVSSLTSELQELEKSVIQIKVNLATSMITVRLWTSIFLILCEFVYNVCIITFLTHKLRSSCASLSNPSLRDVQVQVALTERDPFKPPVKFIPCCFKLYFANNNWKVPLVRISLCPMLML